MERMTSYKAEQILTEMTKVAEFLLGTEDAYNAAGEQTNILAFACETAMEKLNGILDSVKTGAPLVIWDRNEDFDT